MGCLLEVYYHHKVDFIYRRRLFCSSGSNLDLLEFGLIVFGANSEYFHMRIYQPRKPEDITDNVLGIYTL